MDAFVNNLDLFQLGFTSTVHKREAHRPLHPA